MVSSGLAALGDFAQAVSVPLYAKLADVFGRKPLLLFGIGLFLTASVLCGLAWSMPVLIVARALQGLGAGAILPITIAGDIYTVEERSKIQGYLASVWAISSVVGPTLGGIFCQYLTWRWAFWINIPLGLVAATLLIRRFHEKVVHREHQIDYPGIVLLTTALSLLILGILEGGQAWPWDSVVSIAILTAGAVLLVVFVFVERRAKEPVLPLWVFTRRLLLTTSLSALVCLVLTVNEPSVFWVTFACFVAGAGFGLSATPTTVAAQSSVPWNERGAVTGNNQFARAVGSAVLQSEAGGAEVAANLISATGRVFAVGLLVSVLTWVVTWAMPRDDKKRGPE